ncbi:MAG: tyrosine-type recombinase/integrase [Maricaulaceae bacterium]
MTKVNPNNERLKLDWLKELERDDSPSTIDHKLAALACFEEATDYLDFEKITVEAVDAFTAFVVSRPTRSRTDVATVNSVKSFFQWMVMDERIKGKLARRPINALRLKRKDRTASGARKARPIATIAQIEAAVKAMPKNTAIERRNRALVAFTLVCGARDGAIISMRVKHVDLINKQVHQDPNEVDTKAGKQIHTWFFPVGEFFIQEVEDYLAFLKTEQGFTAEDYLFTSSARGRNEHDQFCIVGLTKERWANAQPMRDIFRAAFNAVDLPYFNPHSFRKTLMALAYDLELSGEQIKAWSQNLGHTKLDTSVNSYGAVSPDRQRARMLEMHNKPAKDETERAGLIADILAVIDARDRHKGAV